jgi:AcrR family transcriptional regulator
MIDAEAEFDRFVAGLGSSVPPSRDEAAPHRPGLQRKRKGPAPRVTATQILEQALVLLDEEGVAAVTVPRLAAGLEVSTRNLYKRITDHDSVIRSAVTMHFTSLDLLVSASCSWDSTAWDWCNDLHEMLVAHPNLTTLMTEEDARILHDKVGDLADLASWQGIPHGIAAACCRSLVDVTINHALRQVREVRRPQCSGEAGVTAPEPTSRFRETVRWILAGVRSESSQGHGGERGSTRARLAMTHD